jgi:AsmA-like C-terminal region
MQRALRWIAIGGAAFLVVVAIVAGVGSRTETLRRLVVETLAERLDSEVALASFSVDLHPTVDIRGEGLVVRLKGARDVPPLVTVKSFIITGGMFGLAMRPRTFRTVTLQGLEINIPPGGARLPHDRTEPATVPDDQRSTSPIHVDRLESTDAVLRLIPRKAGKAPREFAIHHLVMTGVGVHQRMPFEAELTNPIPRGLIKTSGRFGPWNRESPGGTPLDGKYLFDKADLSTIKGIGGILTSRGQFTGELGRIGVSGETQTPDFHLDYADKPVPLTTRFEAVVDGTDGDTYLNVVNALLQKTAIVAKGAVEGTKGVKGRTVKLQVRIDDGRMEDLLQLSVKSATPVLTGRMKLETDFLLPPGEPHVIDRLRLGGTFHLSSARFTDRKVQEKLAEMSARAKGRDPDTVPGAVASDLQGKFTLASGVISFADLRFHIPGATVQMAGSYGLRNESLDFDGTLRMDATISQAAGGGMTGTMLKIVDPLFKKKGAGALIPIRVRGTREDPKFGVDVVKALTPK